MKLFEFRLALLLFAAVAAAQQTPAPTDPAVPPPPPGPQAQGSQAQGSQSQEPGPNAHVLFSRSDTDDSSDTGASGKSQPSPAKPALPPAASSIPAPAFPATPATDAERQAITFLSYDLAVHLEPRQQAMAVRAHMVLRNDGDVPLKHLPLQISSTLHWTGIRLGDTPATFAEHTIESDADHTGRLDEAVITLGQPLAPKASLALDATYEGTVPLSSQRLERIGTPHDVALHSDWDRVSEDFVGLRGFGNLAWYPVASVPVMLGDGNKLFVEIADRRLRQMGTMVSMRITEEFFNSPPNLAVLDGRLFAVAPESLPPSASLPGIVTVSLPPTRLGFVAPSLFLASRTPHDGDSLKLFTRPEDETNVQGFITAAAKAEPMIRQWMGGGPQKPLAIIDLPEREDASFENGAVLFAGIQSAGQDQLTGLLVHSLTHARFASPYPWLEEGAASFMGTLWLERNQGREAALAQLDTERGALALAEPDGSAGEGESLVAAKDPVYYRTKAAYVFWMLRGLVGDDALALAFHNYDPAADAAGTEFERVLEQTSGKDLSSFFSNWVYRDRGLPDLSIAGVHPSSANAPRSYIVAVDVLNSGSAEADVPVSVRSDATTVTERLLVPAQSRVTHRFLIQGQPEEVTVNDGTIPEIAATIHSEDLSFQP